MSTTYLEDKPIKFRLLFISQSNVFFITFDLIDHFEMLNCRIDEFKNYQIDVLVNCQIVALSKCSNCQEGSSPPSEDVELTKPHPLQSKPQFPYGASALNQIWLPIWSHAGAPHEEDECQNSIWTDIQFNPIGAWDS